MEEASNYFTCTFQVRLLHEHDPYIRKAAGLTIATLLHKVRAHNQSMCLGSRRQS